MPLRMFAAVLYLVVGLATVIGWRVANVVAVPPDTTLYGAAYQPYRAGQGPGPDDPQPSRAEIAEDMAILARYVRSIRMYSSLGAGRWIVEEASRHGLDVMLGIWIDHDPLRRRAEIEAAVALARNDRVTSLIVGNEAVLRKNVAPPELIGLAEEVRARTGKPVTTAEPWDVWLRYPQLADRFDFITIHVLPYWERATTRTALDVAKNDINQVRRAFPGKRIVVGETGWPGGGKEWWHIDTGILEEAAFVRGIFAWMNREGIAGHVMEAFDSPWKYSIEGSPGAHWGIWTADRAMKFALTGPVARLPEWRVYAWSAVASGLLLSLLVRGPGDRLGGVLVKTVAVFLLVNAGAVLALLSAVTYFTTAGAVTWGLLTLLLVGVVAILAGDVAELAGILDRPSRSVRAPADGPMPVVSIHVPIHREPPAVVVATLHSLAGLDWPPDRLEVIVLDNNTPEEDLWRPVEAECTRLNLRLARPVFRFIHCMGVTGFKAGALNRALAETRADAEAIAVVDADYVLAPEWLRWTAPLLADDRVGFVQAPQDHRDGTANPFKGWIAHDYDGFFHIGMVERDKVDAIILHGTMCMVRRSALVGVGGWRSDTITEDAELGLRLHAAGWRSAYVRRSLGRGLLPDDWPAFAGQRYRWAYGGMRIALLHRRLLFGRSALTPAQRWCYVAGWFPWVGDTVGLVLCGFAVPWTAIYVFWPGVIELPPSPLVAATLSVFLFRFGYGLAMHRWRVPCGFRASLRAVIAGTALAPTIGLAMLHAAVAPDMPFHRTPKATPGEGGWRARLRPALRAVRLEIGLAAALSWGAWAMLWQRWWDPAAVCWGTALALAAMPSYAAVFLALRSAGARSAGAWSQATTGLVTPPAGRSVPGRSVPAPRQSSPVESEAVAGVVPGAGDDLRHGPEGTG